MTPKEKEVSKAFSTYWKTHFSRGEDAFEKVLTLWHPDITAIGTGKDEIVKSYIDFKKFLQREFEEVNTTMPVKILWKKINVLKDQAVVLGEVEVIVSRENNIKMHFRVSHVFKKQKNKWLLYHIHGSIPATAQRENESFPIDGLLAEKEKLEKEVTEKTAELLNKNRELEIEAALERVRSVAMGMKRRDDMLKICKAISQELKKLGVKDIRNVQTAIFYPAKSSYMNYEYYAKHNRTFITDVSYKTHRVQQNFAQKMMKGEGASEVKQFKGKKLLDWYAYQKTTNQFADKYLLTADSLNYYWFSLGAVAMGFSTYKPLSKEELGLFARFRNVFELAYKRYIDIEKAEAQAKEAQIEAALERVRSRSMAMHKSDEIAAVASVLFHQLQQLDLPNLRRCLVGIVNEKKERLQSWHTSLLGDSTHKVIDYPIDGHPVIKKKINGWRKGKPFSIELSPEELKDFIKYIVKHGFEFQKGEKHATKLIQNHAPFKYGYLEVATHEPISDKDFELVQRFARVFEQTYTRFLDLQKAEAQARESQIEAALERVRSRSLAMHSSEELNKVVALMYEQVNKLDVSDHGCSIIICDEKTKVLHYWYAEVNQSQSNRVYNVPVTNQPVVQKQWNSWRKGISYFSIELTGKEKKEYDDFLINETDHKYLPQHVIDGWRALPKIYFTYSNMKYGLLEFVDNKSFNEENFPIYKRFAKVFEQTYTRFLDLQKAEAQAREAQIEAALERVRSRSLAMHESKDLEMVITILLQQLEEIGILLDTASIVIPSKDKKTSVDWTASKKYKYSKGLIVPFMENGKPALSGEINRDMVDALKSGKEFTKSYSRKEKNIYFQNLFDKSGFSETPEERKEFLLSLPGISVSTAGSKNSYIQIFSYSGEELSATDLAVLKRFAMVFEQCYVRFQDLEKAEAQAREAQIEASLEKVRAQAMGMMKPEDLLNICKAQFTELKQLGFGDLRNSLISIFNDDKGFFLDYDYSDFAGGSINNINYNAHPAITNSVNKIRKGKEVLSEFSISGKELDEWNEYRRNIGEREDPRLENISALYYYMYSIGSGAIGISNFKPVTEEQLQILKRFRNVFDLAYRRYNDIAFAEAQAREAQIETALERVRSRSLAMHHTSELQDVINTVYQQFKSLEIDITGGAFIAINEENKNEVNCWGAGGTADYVERVHIPFFDQPIYTGLLNGIKKGPGFYTEEFSYEEKIGFFKHLFKHPPYTEAPPERKKEIMSRQGGYTRSCAVSKYTSVFIINHHGRKFSEEENNILTRFGKVFEQTYTRFLDLQKAEAQAREAQIEAALERVRSRAMAMHNSNELADVAKVMFNQIKLLGGDLFAFGIVLCDKNENIVEQWHGLGEGEMMTPFQVPIDLDYIHHFRYDQWKAGVELFSIEIPSDYIAQHFERMFELPSVKAVKEDLSAKGINLVPPPWEIDYGASFKNGYLLVSSLKLFKEAKIFPRFAKVFEQAYTRFLDLQKAEEQAREAQIEAALERVRSKAMAMHSSDDLADTVEVLYKELETLQVHALRFGHAKVNSVTKTVELHTATDLGKVVGHVKLEGHPLLEKIYEHVLTKEDLHYTLQGEEMKSYYSILSSAIEVPIPPEGTVQYGYFFFLGDTANYAWSDRALNEEELKVYGRLITVLNLTYKRYEELKNSEAQAREAQIEAALEKVRARTMGMQKSEELKEVIQLVYEQFVHLNIYIEHTGFILDYKTRDDLHIWLADQNEMPSEITIPCFDSPPNNSIKAAKEKGENFFAYLLTFEEKNKFYQELFKFIPGVPQESLEYYFNCPGLAGSGVLLENIGLYIENFSGTPYTVEENAVLMRFGKVFQQTYTRFLDLQKAEAQAREAKIEAALEKVRSRSLAMHKADELGEVASVVFEKLRELDMPVTDGVAIVTHIEGSKDQVEWMESPDYPSAIKVYQPYYEHPILADYWKAKIAGLEYIAPRYTAEQNRAFLKHIFEFTDYKHTPQKIKDYCLSAETYSYFAAFQKNSSIFINDYSGRSLSEQEIDIIKRFSKVFEQAYTRFLDLQKAEAQARESQIEASLERVRARSMAMHKSDELLDVIEVISEQLHQLGFQFDNVSFAENNQAHDYKFWLSVANRPGAYYLDVPYIDNPMFERAKEAQQKGLTFYSDVLTPEENRNWHKHVFDHNNMDFVNKDRKEYIFTRGFARSIALLPNIMLIIGNYSSKPYSEDENEIINRFAIVFQQSYTRFNDLKQAEVQARESKIQLALERVRARTMAMHKSEELSETVAVLFQQFNELGSTPERMNICLINEEAGVLEVWSTEQGGKKINHSFNGSLKEPTTIAKIFAGWKERKKSMIVDLAGKELNNWIRYLQEEMKMPFKEELRHKRRVHTMAFFSKGVLLISTPEPVPQETTNLLQRFADVFNLTYRRFLDLQKAEEQALEAQIEAALERVRSKTMAMYRSEQLAETAKVLFEQFDLLGIYIDRMSIGIFNEETNKAEFWLTDQVGNKLDNKYFFPLDEPTSMIKIYNAWQSRKDSVVVDLTGNELKSWLKFINENVKLPINVSNIKDRRVHQVAFFSSGFLMSTTSEPVNEEKIQILVRFAKVFDLTYTRFQDLQKAEAQTRESEIQLALERVRARTLAMQNSGELVDAAAVVFQQLIHLGIEPNRIYIAIIKDEEGNADFWITDEDGSKVSSGFHPNLNDNKSFKKMFEGWKNKDKSMTIDMQGEELNKYLTYLAKQNVPFKGGLSQKRRLQYVAYFSKGFIGVASPDETKPETLQLLERFAAVFNLTYTRFNDLLQAEAQNKIIQAENERKTKELEDARELQLSMLPKELPKLPHIDIAVYMNTATEVGGDYYDFNIDDNGTLTFILGDATGHGMMSGMMVSIMKSFFISSRNQIELKHFFEDANNSIKDMKLGRLMMAVVGVQITSTEIIATNAGMPSLVYFRNKSQKVGEFVSNNLPLGGMKGTKYMLKSIRYEKGDTLLLMSDGLAELKNSNGEQYGYARIKDEFGSIAQRNPEEIIEYLKNSANEWVNGVEPDDDVTFVVIKIK